MHQGNSAQLSTSLTKNVLFTRVGEPGSKSDPGEGGGNNGAAAAQPPADQEASGAGHHQERRGERHLCP